MAGFKEKDFNERRNAAADAKKALLERYKAKVQDPSLAERQAERVAAAKERELRQAQRKAEKEAEAKRSAEEKAAREAAEAAERIAQAEKAEADQAALLAAQKAARDARYAARKARK